MAHNENVCCQNIIGLIPLYFILAVALVPISVYFITLPTNTVREVPQEYVLDYTNCVDSINEDQTCYQYAQLNPEKTDCSCFISFNLSESFDGNVTVSYELESFDLSRLNLSSRDDKQLMGELSSNPSENCGKYRYVGDNATEQIPIVPCGEIADYMFSDSFRFKNLDLNKIIFLKSGAISAKDKLDFQNPANFSDFENYAKPINWIQPIHKLQPDQPDNNGLMNERFISWMKTEWKRKPIGTVRKDPEFANGLPSGIYQLRVGYIYPITRYNGTRKVILSTYKDKDTKNNTSLIIGITGLAVAFVLLSLAIILYGYTRKATTEEPKRTDVVAKNELQAMVASNVD